MIEEKLSILLKDSVKVFTKSPLSGGDINEVYHLKTNVGSFCVKQNDTKRFPGMLAKEAKGLGELREKSNFQVPEVIATFEETSNQYLILEFIETGKKTSSFWEDFGIQLAQMHQSSEESFGWVEDNYIGSLTQSNHVHQSWSEFYASERLMPQVKFAFDAGLIDSSLVKNFEKIYPEIGQLFPIEPPSLLHGDLWSGNYLCNRDGSPVLIDPATYYGHREMDLGMMHLFGGFSDTLFETYNDQFPLENRWKDRIPLTQLYPLLVHVNLFGGHYIQSVKTAIHRFL